MKDELTIDSASGEGPTGEIRKLNDIDVSRTRGSTAPPSGTAY